MENVDSAMCAQDRTFWNYKLKCEVVGNKRMCVDECWTGLKDEAICPQRQKKSEETQIPSYKALSTKKTNKKSTVNMRLRGQLYFATLAFSLCFLLTW